MAIHISKNPKDLEGKNGVHILIVKKLNRKGGGYHTEHQVRIPGVGVVAVFYDDDSSNNIGLAGAKDYAQDYLCGLHSGCDCLRSIFFYDEMEDVPKCEPQDPKDYSVDQPEEDLFLVRQAHSQLYVSFTGWGWVKNRDGAYRFTLEEAVEHIKKYYNINMVIELDKR